uniref:Uncharacterized protein n=1 Tax=Triticum urartu TaxID=4572 RepID=A0A8R7P3V1_TRIUA
MRSSSLSNAAASVAVSGSDTAFLATGTTRSLASHAFTGTVWTSADTSGDIAAHHRKMASDADAVAAAASATTPVTSPSAASAGASMTCLEACRIAAARPHSSFSARLRAGSDAATITPSPSRTPARSCATLCLSASSACSNEPYASASVRNRSQAAASSRRAAAACGSARNSPSTARTAST